ncbi:MAG: hypothetical protein AAGA59_00650 [Actinomycetota bacterium]
MSLRATAYVIGMGIVIAGGSTLVVVGMHTVRSGVGAVALAAVVPLAGLVWVLSISALQPGARRRGGHGSTRHRVGVGTGG